MSAQNPAPRGVLCFGLHYWVGVAYEFIAKRDESL